MNNYSVKVPLNLNDQQSAAGKCKNFDLPVLVFLLGATLCLFIVAGPAGNFPVNDDWIYANAIKSIVTTGEFRIAGSNAFDFLPICCGSIVCGIAGFSYDALRCTSICFQLIGIAGIFYALKECKLKSLDAAILSSVYAFSPFLLNLSLSFMTDVPALALSNWTIFLTLAALNRRSLPHFLAAMLALTAAMSVRQTSLVLLPALLIAGLITLPTNKNRLCFLASMILPASSLVFLQKWLASASTAPGGHQEYTQLLVTALTNSNVLNVLEVLSKSCCYWGLFLAPITVPLFFLVMRKGDRTLLAVSALASFAVLAVLINLQRLGSVMPYCLNLFYPPLLGSYGIVGGASGWKIAHLQTFTYVSSAAAFILVFVLPFCFLGKNSERERTGSTLLTFTIAMMLASSVFGIYLQLLASNFDRYLLTALAPLIVSFGLLWCRLETKSIRFAACALSMALAVYGVVAAADVMNFSRTQARATKFLIDKGVNIACIDGGPAFVLPQDTINFSKTFKQGVGWPEKMRGKYSSGALRWWPILSDDYIISSIPIAGYDEYETFSYWSSLSWKNKPIYVLRASSLGF